MKEIPFSWSFFHLKVAQNATKDALRSLKAWFIFLIVLLGPFLFAALIFLSYPIIYLLAIDNIFNVFIVLGYGSLGGMLAWVMRTALLPTGFVEWALALPVPKQGFLVGNALAAGYISSPLVIPLFASFASWCFYAPDQISNKVEAFALLVFSAISIWLGATLVAIMLWRRWKYVLIQTGFNHFTYVNQKFFFNYPYLFKTYYFLVLPILKLQSIGFIFTQGVAIVLMSLYATVFAQYFSFPAIEVAFGLHSFCFAFIFVALHMWRDAVGRKLYNMLVQVSQGWPIDVRKMKAIFFIYSVYPGFCIALFFMILKFLNLKSLVIMDWVFFGTCLFGLPVMFKFTVAQTTNRLAFAAALIIAITIGGIYGHG